MATGISRNTKNGTAANLAYEAQLWQMANTLRASMEAPPAGNANYAWVQHFIHHLAPTGLAGFVLANGSMSSNQSGEGDIRRARSNGPWSGGLYS